MMISSACPMMSADLDPCIEGYLFTRTSDRGNDIIQYDKTIKALVSYIEFHDDYHPNIPYILKNGAEFPLLNSSFTSSPMNLSDINHKQAYLMEKQSYDYDKERLLILLIRQCSPLLWTMLGERHHHHDRFMRHRHPLTLLQCIQSIVFSRGFGGSTCYDPISMIHISRDISKAYAIADLKKRELERSQIPDIPKLRPSIISPRNNYDSGYQVPPLQHPQTLMNSNCTAYPPSQFVPVVYYIPVFIDSPGSWNTVSIPTYSCHQLNNDPIQNVNQVRCKQERGSIVPPMHHPVNPLQPPPPPSIVPFVPPSYAVVQLSGSPVPPATSYSPESISPLTCSPPVPISSKKSIKRHKKSVKDNEVSTIVVCNSDIIELSTLSTICSYIVNDVVKIYPISDMSSIVSIDLVSSSEFINVTDNKYSFQTVVDNSCCSKVNDIVIYKKSPNHLSVNKSSLLMSTVMTLIGSMVLTVFISHLGREPPLLLIFLLIVYYSVSYLPSKYILLPTTYM